MEAYQRTRRMLKDAVADMMRQKDDYTVSLLSHEQKRRELLQKKLNDVQAKLIALRETLSQRDQEIQEYNSTITVLNRMVEGFYHSGGKVSHPGPSSSSSTHQDDGSISPRAGMTRHGALGAIRNLGGDAMSTHDVERMKAQMETLKSALDQRTSEEEFLQAKVKSLEGALQTLLTKMEDTSLRQAQNASLEALGKGELGELGEDQDLLFFATEQSQQIEEMRDLRRTIKKLVDEREHSDVQAKRQEKDLAMLRIKLLEREQVMLAQTARMNTMMAKHREEVLVLQQKIRYEQTSAKTVLDSQRNETSHVHEMLMQKTNEIIELQTQLGEMNRSIRELREERKSCTPTAAVNEIVTTQVKEQTKAFEENQKRWESMEAQMQQEIQKLNRSLNEAKLQMKCYENTVQGSGSVDSQQQTYQAVRQKLNSLGGAASDPKVQPIVEELIAASQKADAAMGLVELKQTQITSLETNVMDLKTNVQMLSETNTSLSSKCDSLMKNLAEITQAMERQSMSLSVSPQPGNLLTLQSTNSGLGESTTSSAGGTDGEGGGFQPPPPLMLHVSMDYDEDVLLSPSNIMSPLASTKKKPKKEAPAPTPKGGKKHTSSTNIENTIASPSSKKRLTLKEPTSTTHHGAKSPKGGGTGATKKTSNDTGRKLSVLAAPPSPLHSTKHAPSVSVEIQTYDVVKATSEVQCDAPLTQEQSTYVPPSTPSLFQGVACGTPPGPQGEDSTNHSPNSKRGATFVSHNPGGFVLVESTPHSHTVVRRQQSFGPKQQIVSGSYKHIETADSFHKGPTSPTTDEGDVDPSWNPWIEHSYESTLTQTDDVMFLGDIQTASKGTTPISFTPNIPPSSRGGVGTVGLGEAGEAFFAPGSDFARIPTPGTTDTSTVPGVPARNVSSVGCVAGSGALPTDAYTTYTPVDTPPMGLGKPPTPAGGRRTVRLSSAQIQTDAVPSNNFPDTDTGITQTMAVETRPKSAQCTLLQGALDVVIHDLILDEAESRTVWIQEEHMERQGCLFVFHRFKVDIIERESSSTHEIQRHKEELNSVQRAHTMASEEFDRVVAQQEVNNMIKLETNSRSRLSISSSSSSNKYDFTPPDENAADMKKIEQEKERLHSMVLASKTQDKEIVMLKEFVERQRWIMDQRNEANEAELRSLRSTLHELESKSNSAAGLEKEIGPLRSLVDKMLTKLPQAPKATRDLLNPEQSEAVKMLAQNSLAMQREHRILIEQLTRSQQRVEQLEAHEQVQNAMMDAKNRRLEETQKALDETTYKLLEKEKSARLIIQAPPRIIERVVDKVIVKDDEYRGHVTSFLSTVGNFVLHAQTLLHPDALEQGPLMYPDRPLVSHEHVEVKLKQLLTAMQRHNEQIMTDNEEEEEEGSENGGEGQESRKSSMRKSSIKKLPSVVTVERGSSGMRVTMQEACLSTEEVEHTPVSCQTERPTTIPNRHMFADDLEASSGIEVNFTRVPDARLEKAEDALGTKLLNVKHRLLKLQMSDALDTNLRAAATFLTEEKTDKPTVFSPEDTVQSLQTIVTRSRSEGLRGRILQHVSKYHETEAQQKFMKEMFKAFPSAFLEKSSEEFSPKMLTQAIVLLADWWNKWSNKAEVVNKQLLSQKQNQLHRILELCDLLGDITTDLQASYDPSRKELQPTIPLPEIIRSPSGPSKATLEDTLRARGRVHQQTLLHVFTTRMDVFSLTPGGMSEDSPNKPYVGLHGVRYHNIDAIEIGERAKKTLAKMGVLLDPIVQPTPPPTAPEAVQGTPPQIRTKSKPLRSDVPQTPQHDFSIQRGSRTIKCVVPRSLSTPIHSELLPTSSHSKERQDKRRVVMRGDYVPKPTSVLDAFMKRARTDMKDTEPLWSSTRERVLPALKEKMLSSGNEKKLF